MGKRAASKAEASTAPRKGRKSASGKAKATDKGKGKKALVNGGTGGRRQGGDKGKPKPLTDGDPDADGKPAPPKKTREELALDVAKSMVSKVNKRISDFVQSQEAMKGQKTATSLIAEVKECHAQLVSLLELVRKHATCRQSAFDVSQCVKDGNACVRKLSTAKSLLAKAKPCQATLKT